MNRPSLQRTVIKTQNFARALLFRAIAGTPEHPLEHHGLLRRRLRSLIYYRRRKSLTRVKLWLLNPRPAKSFVCPIPSSNIQRAAGACGGQADSSADRKMFMPAFAIPCWGKTRWCTFDAPSGKLAFTTDSTGSSPVFPGWRHGLRLNGTVNDLAMCGARPL